VHDDGGANCLYISRPKKIIAVIDVKVHSNLEYTFIPNAFFKIPI
jgi:hypothetical protein